MIFGAILAGGTGKRMNIKDGSLKQFLMLGDKPIIIHTIKQFLLSKRIDYIFVGVHKDWIEYMQELVEKHIGNTQKIKIVSGGSDRNETIMNICNAIEKNFGESEENVIITHDAVRPFVTLRIIEENIDMAIKYNACDTVIPATDTIVVSEDNNEINSIPDRSKMYQGQTPQSFKINLLKKLYASLDNDEKNILTDACKICVIRNVPVKLIQGETSNMKITTMSDYKTAQALLKIRE